MKSPTHNTPTRANTRKPTPSGERSRTACPGLRWGLLLGATARKGRRKRECVVALVELTRDVRIHEHTASTVRLVSLSRLRNARRPCGMARPGQCVLPYSATYGIRLPLKRPSRPPKKTGDAARKNSNAGLPSANLPGARIVPRKRRSTPIRQPTR